MEQAPREVERRSRGRLIAFKALAVLFGLGAAIGLFGAGIIVAWFDTEGGGIHRVHDIGFGVLGGVFLTVGFLAQLHAPERKVSVRYQIVAAGVAAMVAGLLASDPGNGLFFLLMSVGGLALMVAVHPAGMELMRGEGSFSPVMAVLAAAGAVPLVWVSLIWASLQRTGLDIGSPCREGSLDDHDRHGLGHPPRGLALFVEVQRLDDHRLVRGFGCLPVRTSFARLRHVPRDQRSLRGQSGCGMGGDGHGRRAAVHRCRPMGGRALQNWSEIVILVFLVMKLKTP